MKKIFCFLNGPYLGGAERSFILQAADVRERLGHDVRFFVPFLEKPGEEQKLISFLRENNFGVMKVHHFQYDKSLFGLSRNNPFSFLLLFPLAIIGLVKTAKNIHRINGDAEEGDVWWTGGNKIGFILFVLGVVTSFKGQFFWHFRDYPFLGGPYRFVWKLLEIIKTFNLTLIGNSFDVQKSLSRLVKESSGIPTVCLYNPVGKLKFQPRSEGSSFVIGTASMFAPWKGLHSLIVFAGLYENELKLLGISEFVIYGDEIYKTKGAHLGYKNSLERLRDSFLKDKSFVRFAGLEKPSVIFSELDVFIHSSLKPEPFGRVLLEAFHSATVLISTGLGGSGELFTDGVNGHKYLSHDYEGLLRKIKQAVGENHHYYLEQGKQRALEIEAIYDRQVVDIFS
jgi:glycosyltransferase involved in cell wall biosynthesis